MIYLKIAIFREDQLTGEPSRQGTAEFMFRDFEPESAARLARALLKARDWRYGHIIDAVEGDFPRDFPGSPSRQRLFREAKTDDVAYEISESPGVETATSMERVA